MLLDLHFQLLLTRSTCAAVLAQQFDQALLALLVVGMDSLPIDCTTSPHLAGGCQRRVHQLSKMDEIACAFFAAVGGVLFEAKPGLPVSSVGRIEQLTFEYTL